MSVLSHKPGSRTARLDRGQGDPAVAIALVGKNLFRLGVRDADTLAIIYRHSYHNGNFPPPRAIFKPIPNTKKTGPPGWLNPDAHFLAAARSCNQARC